MRARTRAERARDLLHTTLTSIGDAVISTDQDGKVTFLNAIAEQLTGWTQKDAANKPISEIFIIRNENTGEAAEIPVERVMREGVIVSLANHTVLRRKDGREIPIEDSAAPISDLSKNVLGAVLVFRDVSARRQQELALKKSEERLKLALDAGKVGVWDWNLIDNSVEWSEQVYDMYGVAPDKFGGKPEDFTTLVHPDDRAAVEDAIRSSLQNGTRYEPEFRAIHPQKGVRWMANSGQVLRNDKGEAVRFLGSVSDITDRKLADAQLLQQWHTFDTALSNTPDFNYVFDLEGRFTYVNRARLRMFRKTREEVLGKNFLELGYPPELAERFLREIQEVIQTKQPLQGEAPFTAPSGITRQYDYIFVPVLSPSGEVESVVGTTHDITERKLVEERIRASEERLTLALEAGGGVGTWDWDVVNELVVVNRRLAELFSIPPERAAIGVSIEEMIKAIHPDDREMVRQNLRKTLEGGGGDFEAEYRVMEGTTLHWVHSRGRCQGDAQGKPVRFSGVLFEITDRKSAEEALRKSENYLRAIYGGMYEYMGLLSPEGIILDSNPASLKFANNTREDVLGRPFWDAPWFSNTPGIPEVIKGAVELVAAGDSLRREMTLIRPNGEPRVFDFSMHPIRDDKGDVVSIVPEGRDITDLKRAEAELKRSNEELTRVNRELEQFAYVASHDLQEPLRMVNIYTQLIVEDTGENPKESEVYAGFVRDGVRRMEGLIRDLLTFSRAVHSDRSLMATAELSDALQEALSVLKSRIDECGATVIAQDRLPAVCGDESQIAHVFQNLISNALKYRKQHVPPEIHVNAAREGTEWIISIRDNGIGFEPQYSERIFGLFKRLHKEEYPGTGLGLAICQRIIERHGGRIWAEGMPGEGATFYFSLPVELSYVIG